MELAQSSLSAEKNMFGKIRDVQVMNPKYLRIRNRKPGCPANNDAQNEGIAMASAGGKKRATD